MAEQKENAKKEASEIEAKTKKKSKKTSRFSRKRPKEDYELIKARKKRRLIETIAVVIIAVIMLVLLCNRTFFREEYKTGKIDLEIPLLSFFVKDEDGELVFKTLRKSDYLKEYFDGYLSGMTRYNCGKGFYYDESTRTAIYSIDVEKTFAVKTIRVRYENGDADCLCEGSTSCEKEA